MKIQIPASDSSRGGLPTPRGGFTMTEVLIAMTVFLFVLVGILSANLFGLRMFQVNQSKLTATEWSRNTFGKITAEVHAANSISILNVDINGNGTGLFDGETQQGNGLQIYPTTDTNNYTIYFVNLADQTFRRTVATLNSTHTDTLADSVTNTMIFSAQDMSGNVLTNNVSNRVIHLALDFYQPARFMQEPYSYQLETSMKQRIAP